MNDGVCDYDLCCDGSDEWAKVGGKVCQNKCKEVGKEWRKHDEQRQKALGAAAKRRKELVAEAARLKKEIEDRIQSLGTQIEGSVIKVKDLEAALAEVERKEKGKIVRGPGKASRTSMLAGLAKDRIEELRGALLEVWGQRDAAREKIAELESILSKFKEEYNPNFNDEGVKRAVRSWEEYAAREKPADGDAAHDRDLGEITKPDLESGAIQWSDWEDPEEGDVDVRKCSARFYHIRPILNNTKSTKLKNIFQNQFETGLTKNYELYAWFSSKTAYWPARTIQAQSLMQWLTRVKV